MQTEDDTQDFSGFCRRLGMRLKDNRKPEPCASCSESAQFFTPVGLFCQDHALYEALQQADGDERWIPIPVPNPRLTPIVGGPGPYTSLMRIG